ncbi:hypothetical protein L5515_007646 [Caenorhabditis briggsae]|uniref:RRM domain-containing protein n=1 Tax=Caenorhabditis briggsae TaxID=6238 RepID=A0AAE9F4W2_CAEBR|nr:hypothetical protein L3Y34_007804 [Caenorhabditis briggsae]UMM34680.1 hypothetical protein L5515_007646 [Caenorhabditis briggsae]
MPSKLFVGNLPDNVDSNKLKQVFQPFCKVTECDIVKNYAFVHIEEDDVDSIITRLTGYTIEGKVVNIKKSTSKLRPTPGMPNRCFRCQSDDHRTPQCPQDPSNSVKNDGIIKIDLTAGGGGLKRPAVEPILDMSKRMAFAPQAVVEPEVPRPMDPDLQALYQEYQLSRQRYVYYRDRLLKEMEAKQHGSTAGFALSSTSTIPVPVASAPPGATQLSAAPVSYQPAAPPSLSAVNAPYAAPSNLRAPYALQSAPYASAMPPAAPYGSVNPPQSSGVMTTQQYLQQMQQQHTGSPAPVPAPARY